MSIILETDALDLKRRFLRQHCLREKGHQTIVDIKITGTRIVYKLIVAGPQSQKDLNTSVNSADDKEREAIVNFHVRVCAVLDNDIEAHVKEYFKVAKLDVTKDRLGCADDIISSTKQWLISDSGYDITRCLCDHIDEVCGQWALQNSRYFCLPCVDFSRSDMAGRG